MAAAKMPMHELRAWKRKDPRITTAQALRRWRLGVRGLIRGSDPGDLRKPKLPR